MALSAAIRSEERFSRNAETDIVCRLLLEKKKNTAHSRTCNQRCVGEPCEDGSSTSLYTTGVDDSRGVDDVNMVVWALFCCVFFFFNDTATPEIYTLSLHDALPICTESRTAPGADGPEAHRTLPLLAVEG